MNHLRKAAALAAAGALCLFAACGSLSLTPAAPTASPQPDTDAAAQAHLAHHLEHRLVRYADAVHGPQLHGDLAVAHPVGEPAEDLGDPPAQLGPGRRLGMRERVVVRRPGEPGALQQVGQPVAQP